MRNRVLSLLAVLAIGLLLLSGCGGSKQTAGSGEQKSASATGDTIKIGFLGAKTGNHASYGVETLKGMKMAAEDINAAGGVLGKKIEIIEDDHRSNQTEAANVTQKMINQHKVVAIVGDPTTGITKIAGNICQNSKVVLLSAGAVGPGVEEIGDFVFRNTLLDMYAAPAVTKYLVEQLGWKKVALVTSVNNDYSVGLTKIFKDALQKYGAEVVVEQSIKDGDQNFAAQVTNIKQKKVDGIIFTGYYTEGGLFMKEVRKQGLNYVMVGGDGLLSPKLWELGGSAVEGSMVYTGFYPDLTKANDKTKAFVKKYQEKNNNALPDMFSAQGYDAVMLIADAIKKANSADPSVFKNELAKMNNWQGVTGTITFQPDRKPLKSPVYLLEVKNGQWAVKAVLPVSVQ